jgi:hypothetical protein
MPDSSSWQSLDGHWRDPENGLMRIGADSWFQHAGSGQLHCDPYPATGKLPDSGNQRSF